MRRQARSALSLGLTSERNILRPKRKPIEFALNWTKQGKPAGEKEVVLNSRRYPTGVTQSPRQVARKNQLRIYVERTRVYRVDGKRVQWIMLKDGDQPA